MLNTLSSFWKLKGKRAWKNADFGEDVRCDTLKLVKKFIIQSVLLISVALVAIAFFGPGRQTSLPFVSQPSENTRLSIDSKSINIEIADSDDERKKGLGGRQSLATDSGMLFIFEKPGKFGFWMKGLSFPLDLIWIREKRVVDIIKNAAVPSPGAKDEDLPIYMPREEVDMVLEVNSGFVDSQGIKVGDIVEL